MALVWPAAPTIGALAHSAVPAAPAMAEAAKAMEKKRTIIQSDHCRRETITELLVALVHDLRPAPSHPYISAAGIDISYRSMTLRGMGAFADRERQVYRR